MKAPLHTFWRIQNSSARFETEDIDSVLILGYDHTLSSRFSAWRLFPQQTTHSRDTKFLRTVFIYSRNEPPNHDVNTINKHSWVYTKMKKIPFIFRISISINTLSLNYVKISRNIENCVLVKYFQFSLCDGTRRQEVWNRVVYHHSTYRHVIARIPLFHPHMIMIFT